MKIFISFFKDVWEILLLDLFGFIKRILAFILNHKKAVFLYQVISLDLGNNGKLNQIKVKSTIEIHEKAKKTDEVFWKI